MPFDDHVKGFFDFLGDDQGLPLPLRALSPLRMFELLQTDQRVWSAAVAVGATYRRHRRENESAQIDEGLCSVARSAYEHSRNALELAKAEGTLEPSLPSVLCVFLLSIYLVSLFGGQSRSVSSYP